jgi:hypothetical protein
MCVSMFYEECFINFFFSCKWEKFLQNTVHKRNNSKLNWNKKDKNCQQKLIEKCHLQFVWFELFLPIFDCPKNGQICLVRFFVHFLQKKQCPKWHLSFKCGWFYRDSGTRQRQWTVDNNLLDRLLYAVMTQHIISALRKAWLFWLYEYHYKLEMIFL